MGTKRILTPEEKKHVIQQIRKQREENRESTYADLRRGIPEDQKEYYNELINLFMEKDGINDKRDDVENDAYLTYVPVDIPEIGQQQTGNAQAGNTQNSNQGLTKAQIEKIAQDIQRMGYIQKDDLIAQFSTDARDNGEEDIVSDIEKAVKAKKDAKKAILLRAKKMKQLFEDKIRFVEKEIQEIDEKISIEKENLRNCKNQLIKLSGSKSVSRNGKNITEENIDTPEELEAKKKALQEEEESINKKIKDLEQHRSNKNDEKEKLVMQFNTIVARIDQELRRKGIILNEEEEQKQSRDKKLDDSQHEESQPNNSSETQKNGVENDGQPSRARESRTMSANEKANKMLYGYNQGLTKSEILEHIEGGRLDHFIEAKRNIMKSKEAKIFDEKLDQILEEIADENGMLVTVGNRIIVPKKNTTNLSLEEIQSITKRTKELLRKNDLTPEERRELDVMEILILRNMKSHELGRKLALFGINREKFVAIDDAAMEIGHAARARVHKTERNREFLNRILAARGSETLHWNRETDPKSVSYTGKRDIEDIGDSSRYGARADNQRDEI